MRIISFAWTTPAFVTRNKTVTRREWDDGYARSFAALDHCAAYDRSPRTGGKQIGTLCLTRTPYLSAELPAQDWYDEGFEFLQSIGAKLNGHTPRELWDAYQAGAIREWVIRFEIVSLTEYGDKLADEAMAKLGALALSDQAKLL